MKKLAMLMLISVGLTGLMYADSMYGAFQVTTRPSGADVTLFDPDLYLAPTPTPIYPVVMDEYMELREGIPGRAIMLMITKKGYIPLKREIFVPFTHEVDSLAMNEPSVFSFELDRDIKNEHWRVCVYYGYRYRHPRPPLHVHYHPWYPPVHYHHPGWGPPAPRPPAVYPGIIVSGTAQGSGLTASSSHNPSPAVSNTKPKPNKASPPNKIVIPKQENPPAKTKTTEKPKLAAKKESTSKSSTKPVVKAPEPKIENKTEVKVEKQQEEEKDKATKTQTKSKSKN